MDSRVGEGVVVEEAICVILVLLAINNLPIMVGMEHIEEYGEEVLPGGFDSEESKTRLSSLLLENQEKFVFNKQYLKGLLASSVQALNLFSDSKHHDGHDQQVLHGEHPQTTVILISTQNVK